MITPMPLKVDMWRERTIRLPHNSTPFVFRGKQAVVKRILCVPGNDFKPIGHPERKVFSRHQQSEILVYLNGHQHLEYRCNVAASMDMFASAMSAERWMEMKKFHDLFDKLIASIKAETSPATMSVLGMAFQAMRSDFERFNEVVLPRLACDLPMYDFSELLIVHRKTSLDPQVLGEVLPEELEVEIRLLEKIEIC